MFTAQQRFVQPVSVNSTSAWPGDHTRLPTRLGAKFGELVGLLLDEKAAVSALLGLAP